MSILSVWTGDGYTETLELSKLNRLCITKESMDKTYRAKELQLSIQLEYKYEVKELNWKNLLSSKKRALVCLEENYDIRHNTKF